ncbi:MAG: metallophosphoesterase, partial [Candidatus Krumholzibacteriia bacterium]
MRLLQWIVLVIALWLLGGQPSAHATTITRGPYLQSVSTSSAVVVWKNEPATNVELEYGTTLDYGNRIVLPPETLHAVTLTDLVPGTRYYYRILLDGAAAAAGKEYFVRTAPEGGSGKPVEFLVWGDSGQGDEGQLAVTGVLNAQRPDFAIHVGDIVYPNGERQLYDERYFRPYAPLLRSTPVWAALGNHDGDVQAFEDFWYLPTNSVDGSELFYSFDYGDVHFTVLNTNASLTNRVLDWLEADLGNSTSPWKVVFFHHPVYSCGVQHGSSGGKIATLGPIFDAHQVDLVLYGHDHHFERTYPMRNDSAADAWMDPDYVNPSGTIYVVSGGGGGERGVVGNCAHTARALAMEHFVRVRIDENLLTLEAIDTSGRTADQMTLLKSDAAVPEALDLRSPDGGEVLEIGRGTDIRWSSSAGVASVKVELSRSGPDGPWETLLGSTDNDGTEPWTVTGPTSRDCRLRISEATQGMPSDLSTAPFSIVPEQNGPAADFLVRVNFQPDDSDPPAGYLPDHGTFFNPSAGHGWDRTVPTNRRGADADARRDTYVEVRSPDSALWELEVPNGSYRVNLVVGDPKWNGVHRVDIEGLRVVDDVSTSSGFHEIRDHLAAVTDGRLTVRIGGVESSSKKTKLCYIDVRSATGDAATDPPADPQSDPQSDPQPQPTNDPPAV